MSEVEDNLWIVLIVMVVAVCIAAAIIIPVYAVTDASTRRMESCVNSGKQWLHVDNTHSRYECRR